MLNNKEIKFLEDNIKNYKNISEVDLIEELENYMQTKTNFNKNDNISELIESILDKLIKE